MTDALSIALDLPDERLFVHGICVGCPDQAEMFRLLASHGLEVSKGTYNIRAASCESFTFEDEGYEGEWWLEGTAANRATLVKDVQQVFKALVAADVKHYLEISDGVQNRLVHLHHRWPDSE